MKNLKNKPDISIVLGTYNRLPFLKATIKNLREQKIQVPNETIVIDGGSTDGTIKWLTKQKDIISIIQHNHGKRSDGKPITRQSWGYFMNLALKCARGKYVVMISDDCLLIPDSIMNSYDQFEKLLGEGQKIGGLAYWWRNWPNDKEYKINFSIAGYSPSINHGMYLRDALEQAGWIEEDAYMFYCADGDLSYKVCREGYHIEICDTAIVEHYSHANEDIRSANSTYYKQDREVFLERWNELVEKFGTIRGRKIYRSFENLPPIYEDFPSPLTSPLKYAKNIVDKGISLVKQTRMVR